MGKTKIAILNPEGGEPQKTEKVQKKQAKKSAKEAKGIRVPGLKGGERVVAIESEVVEETPKKEVKAQKIKVAKKRGRRYLAAKTKIEQGKSYPLEEAVRLVKEISISRFDSKIDAHAILEKEGQFEIEFPNPFLADKKIEIASQSTIEKLEKGIIDFDILLSTADFMPKLAPFAKILGPKGLLPNPKNGTIISNPQKDIQRFKNSLFRIKTEKNRPILHISVGKSSFSEDKILGNVKALVASVGEKNIKKFYLAPTMGPSIQVDLETLKV